MSSSAILAGLSVLKWSLAVTGAVLVFAFSMQVSLSLVAGHIDAMVVPVQLSPTFNVPAVRQIGSLKPNEPRQTTSAHVAQLARPVSVADRLAPAPIRRAPAETGSVVQLGPGGELARVVEREGPWLKVRTVNGQMWWLNAEAG